MEKTEKWEKDEALRKETEWVLNNKQGPNPREEFEQKWVQKWQDYQKDVTEPFRQRYYRFKQKQQEFDEKQQQVKQLQQ